MKDHYQRYSGMNEKNRPTAEGPDHKQPDLSRFPDEVLEIALELLIKRSAKRAVQSVA
jgi:hypothetical protein